MNSIELLISNYCNFQRRNREELSLNLEWLSTQEKYNQKRPSPKLKLLNLEWLLT